MEQNDIIAEALTDLEEEKKEVEQKIQLINSLDFTKPVTEDEWHKICETPLRPTKIMVVLVKNIFPAAEDIQVGCNYVYFTLYGYNIQIPTSRCRGINISTRWYENVRIAKKYKGKPHEDYMYEIREYLDIKDKKGFHSWKEEAMARLGHNEFSTIGLFFAWFFKYKWRKLDREKFEKRWEEEEISYAKYMEKLELKEKENKEKFEFVLRTVLPELNKFSTKHYGYDNGIREKTVEEICKIENIEYPYAKE